MNFLQVFPDTRSTFLAGGMGWIADDNGGYSSTELEVKNDTFTFNFASASWRTIQPAPFGFEPTHRYAHVGTVAGDQLVLIGGQDVSCYLTFFNASRWD